MCIFNILVAVYCLVSSFSETQDDLEAITNDIKKMANNARNKLKSESASQYRTQTHSHTQPVSQNIVNV